VLLVLVGAVPDFAEPMKEDGARQAIARLVFVEFAPRVGLRLGPTVVSPGAIWLPQLRQVPKARSTAANQRPRARHDG
jgi:hypothetical protein